MIDRNALLDELDMESYTDYLGIEKKRRGTHTFIRCPGHLKRLGKPDRHISNAVLSEKGYYCFSCGEYHNAIDMTEEFLSCGFKQAADTICRYKGLNQENIEITHVNRCPLSKEDLKLIGLDQKRHLSVPNFCGSVYISIDSLYAEDREAYNELIGSKAMDAYKKLTCLINMFASGNSLSEGFSEMISDIQHAAEMREGICRALTDRLARVEKIICTLET